MRPANPCDTGLVVGVVFIQEEEAMAFSIDSTMVMGGMLVAAVAYHLGYRAGVDSQYDDGFEDDEECEEKAPAPKGSKKPSKRSDSKKNPGNRKPAGEDIQGKVEG